MMIVLAVFRTKKNFPCSRHPICLLAFVGCCENEQKQQKQTVLITPYFPRSQNLCTLTSRKSQLVHSCHNLFSVTISICPPIKSVLVQIQIVIHHHVPAPIKKKGHSSNNETTPVAHAPPPPPHSCSHVSPQQIPRIIILFNSSTPLFHHQLAPLHIIE